MLRFLDGIIRRTRHDKVVKSSRRSSVYARRRPFCLETLEKRILLTVSQDIVNQLTPYQNALDTALDVMTSLPLVGEELSELQEWNTVFQDSVNSLASHVDSLTNGHFELAIPLPSLAKTFTFDLGLDAFLQVNTSGGVSAAINPVLNVGFDLTNGVPSLDPTHTGLDIGFVIGLPNFQLTASLNGLLYASAVDSGTTFNGNLGFNFDTNFGIEANFSGDAHVRLGLSLSLVDPALNAPFNPRFFTDLELDWGFDTQSDQLKVPVIAFRNFSLDADSFMQGFLGDTVKGVQKFTKPMQPFIDMFEQPVPIVSSFDSSETMGDLFLKGAGLSQEQQDRFNTMVKIVKAVNTFDFAGTTGGAVINFGDILLTGDARQTGQFFFDTTQLQGVIDDIMNSPALQEVQEKLESVAEYVGFSADAGLKYPLLENPGPVIGSLLTGQTEVMFSYDTGRQHFELGASFGVGIPDLLGFFLNAGIVFDASLSVGYDTAGLLKFIQDPLKRPEDLLHGFYIDNAIDNTAPPIPNVANPRKSAVYLQGYADISASAVVTVSGGIYADIAFELANTSNSTHVYLDDIITGLANNAKVFNPSGRLYAAANIELTLPNPVGPDITLFHYQLSYHELLSFNPPPAPTEALPLTVIDVTNQHTLLLDVTKMTAGGKVKVQPFHDYPITGGNGYAGDGIRVDYPGEIVLYVERKNDVTSNYYNFIGLSGAVPDGVSIDVVDPFTVFATEGAPDPQPPQTESGVLLAGGNNVVYRYTESAGGSLATVLLAGGYGSNSLTGGTMTFGNFIPAARIDQAKSHFGNLTGFDAAGQAYINARIDSVLAPASPAGVIGATMTGSRGGLMYGGPGNNSFYATGPGSYDMVGGAWTNNFTISPSFAGVPATYQIDGGPYGQSTLVVRIPAGDLADFENGTVSDKYNPAFKALDIFSNAGLFATAHGIQIVQASSLPGSTVVIGDTSELNIQFKLKGSGTIKFGGSNAPDDFSVSAVYEPRVTGWASFEAINPGTRLYGTKDRRSALLLRPEPNLYLQQLEALGGFEQLFHKVVKYGPVNEHDQLGQWAWVSPKLSESQWPYLVAVPPGANYSGGAYFFQDVQVDYWYPIADVAPAGELFKQLFPAPTYTIGRTFGSNGRTQNITFELGEANSTQIILDGRGASDNYDVSLGLGSFIDVTIDDSDETTQNSLVVHYGGSAALGEQVELTDNSLKVEYATPLEPTTYNNGNGYYYYYGFGSSVSYSPSVKFDANTDVTFRTGDQFQETIVNRPNAPQKATLQFVNAYRPSGYIFDVQVANPQLHIINGETVSSQVNVVANGGNLVVEVINEPGYTEQYSPSVNVHANSGTVDVEFSKDYFALGPSSLNVYGNSGTVKLDSNRYAGRGGNFNINVVGNNGLVSIGSTATTGSRTFNINATSTTGQVEADLAGFTGLLTFNVLANASNLLVQTTNNYNTFNVQSNTGTLDISETQKWLGAYETFNVLGNAGTINIDALINATDGAFGVYVQGLSRVVNVLANAGSINLQSVVAPILINYGIESQVNIGNQGSLADVHGTINLSNSNGHYGLKIDDRTNPGAGAPWSVDYDKTLIGDLTINYPGVNAPAPYFDNFSKYEAFPKPSSVVTLLQDPPFYYKSYADGAFPGLTLSVPYALYHSDGMAVNQTVTATGPAGASLTFAASNLPAGLSINPTTGLISGTIAPGAWTASPYETIVTVEAGQFRRGARIFWYVESGIAISVDQSNLAHFEGETGSASISATNAFNLPVTFSVTGLPPGISFDAGSSTISGTISPGAAASGPYNVNVHASDGVETADYQIYWAVTGITLSTPANQVDFIGDSVHLAIQGVTVSGAPLVYSANGLPDGLSIDASTGVISGVLTADTAQPSVLFPSITATNGNDVAVVYFSWSVLPPGISNYISINDPGLRNSREGDYDYIGLYASNSLNLPLTYTVTGLPPGLDLYDGGGSYYIYGNIPAGAASALPYHVEIVATDGMWSDTLTFDWIVRPPGTISIQNPVQVTSFVNDALSNFQIYASAGPGEALTFSATGLPTGLSIDSESGIISGTILPVAAIPSVFQTIVTATSASDSATTSFLWTVLSSYNTSYQPNVITLPNPSGVGTFELVSPEGTYLSASISPGAGVALPANVDFPYDFLTFTIEGLQPGQTADLTIAGLDPSIVTDYYKYGATPANPTAHWYNFLFGVATDGDSAVGTGMEIVGGNIVLHLVDGGRGDDDTSMNGVIFDIGGPALGTSTFTLNPATIPENSPGGTVVGDLLPVNAPLGRTFTYSLTNDAGGRFALSGSQIVVAGGASLNFEQISSHVVTVEIEDSNGNIQLQDFTISVTDVNETPTEIALSGSSIVENAGVNAVVGTLTASDPDAGDNFTFTLPVGIDDNSAFNISGNSLRANASFNFEAISSYTVTVRVTDALGLSFDKQFTISVTDVAEVTYSVTGGLLTVTGTGLNDDITVLNDGGAIRIAANGTTLDPGMAAASLTAVSVSGLGGNDTLVIDSTLGAAVLGTLLGGDGDDILLGGAGNDSLSGGPGNDTYVFGTALSAEADTVTEGTNQGSDTLSFASLTTAVTLNLNSSLVQPVHVNRTLKLNAGGTFENIVGGSGDDVLTGNSLDNSFTGNPGNDTMTGGGGDDTYVFGPASVAEADTVAEGTNQGSDTLSFASLTTAVTVALNSSLVQAVHTNRTLQLNFGGTFENIVGGSGDDVLTGNSLDNIFTGNAGNDTMTGGGGNDTYVFGPASAPEADIVAEGANQGSDTLSFASLTTAVTFDLSKTFVQAVHTNRTLKLNSGSTFENIVGGSGDDVLTGNSLNNVLSSSSGNDTLFGFAGRDLLVGGSGTDLFYGGIGDDILISGTVSYFNEATRTLNKTGIDALMAEWTGLNNYTTRISNLRNGTGLNGANVLDVGNVLDDAAIDTLFGEGDEDWFWLFGGDTAPDQGGGEQTN